jgi:hypothetical protein
MEGKKMNLTDFIVNVFCKTDDFMKKYFPQRTLRQRGPMPQLADSEVLTMELVGEVIGLETDKAIFEFFKRFYTDYFPNLSCRVTFARQSAKLWAVKQKLFKDMAEPFQDTIIVLDSFPMHVCKFVRARGSKLFKGIARYGKELGNQTFYGFRLHVKINSIGMIQSFELTSANVHDINMVEEMTDADRGLLLADRAYLSQPLKQQLLEKQGLELSVPTKYGEPTPLAPKQLRFRKHIRRLIETVGNQLINNLHMKKIWARDLWHLTSRICRKILAHMFCVFFCLREGIKPLSFAKLLTV